MARIKNVQVDGYSNLQGLGRFDIRAYGAKGDGVTNDTIAIQAAINAASVAGGGIVFSPPGEYLHSLLTIPGGVSICGVPDTTYWLHNHASANALVFTTWNTGNPVTIQDIRFLGNVASTGTHIVNNIDARIEFIRCSWNGIGPTGGDSNNLQGRILQCGSSLGEVFFHNCLIRVAGDQHGIYVPEGRVTVSGGTITMPATYTSSLIRAAGTAHVSMRGVTADCTGRTGGVTATVMFVDATTTADMTDCELNGTGAVNTIYGFLWAAGARITARGNRWLGNITNYANNTAVAGSSVDLIPYAPLYPGPATSFTIPTGVRNVALGFNGTAPTITMPAILFAGQEITVSIFNDASGGNWAGVAVIGLIFGDTNSINNNRGRTFHAVAMDRNLEGTVEWVVVGAWSSQFI